MNQVSEAMINSSKRENRIDTFKKVLDKKKEEARPRFGDKGPVKPDPEKLKKPIKNVEYLKKGSKKDYQEKNPPKFDKINKK